MKKRLLAMVLTLGLLTGLTACGGQTADTEVESTQKQTSSEESVMTETEENTEQETEQAADATQTSETSNILIAYFTMPEDIDVSGIDADAGASIVVKDEEIMGNLEYMALTIQQAVGGDLFQIETQESYPLDHEPLVDQAAEEQDENARPALATHIENLEQYDTILLGYPNWWGDMPQALYTFLEEYDFSGKTIIPFTAHGGSGFAGTVGTIESLQSEAIVRDDGLSISRNDVADSAEEVSQWALNLGL